MKEKEQDKKTKTHGPLVNGTHPHRPRQFKVLSKQKSSFPSCLSMSHRKKPKELNIYGFKPLPRKNRLSFTGIASVLNHIKPCSRLDQVQQRFGIRRPYRSRERVSFQILILWIISGLEAFLFKLNFDLQPSS